MKKTVLASFLLVLSSFIKADLAISQNDLCLNSETKGIQKSLPASDEAVVNQELVEAFSGAIENGVNDRQQNLQNSFDDYLKRPDDALDLFVKNVIDTNFIIKQVCLLSMKTLFFIASHDKAIVNELDSFTNNQFSQIKFSVLPLSLKILGYAFLYHTGYNGLRFLLERVMPVSYTKTFNEKLLGVYNRFPGITKHLGFFVGLFDAFATHYL